jgi:lipopolysaccharide transport system permease protein
MSKLVIEAGRGRRKYWADLWRFRELFFILAWRDVAVRYQQTTIGLAWAVLRPLLSLAILTVIFGRIAGLPSHGVPYPVFVFAALLPWQFFANALTEAGGSLVENEKLISKVYFPRLVVPTSAVLVCLLDFLASAVILAGLLAWYQIAPTARLLAIPLLTLLAFGAALGPGLLLAALNVEYRDFRYLIPFLVQFGLYLSPVGFSSGVVPEAWRLVYSLNPMVGVIDGFRWAICDPTPLYWPGLAVSAAVTLLGFVAGFGYFRRMERGFADAI